MALRPLEITAPQMKWGEGIPGAPHTTHTEDTMTRTKGKHRAERYRKPTEWRYRRLKNQWYAFIKPDLRRRYRALQSQIAKNVQNYIKKLR